MSGGCGSATGGQGLVEPIDYKRAITRRWPLILVCAIIAAIIAVLIPVHTSATASQTLWQAQALTGVAPSRGSNANAVSAQVSQVEFFSEQQPVYAATAKALKLKIGIVRLRNAITLKSVKSKKKKVPPGSFYVQVEQPTKTGAASMANEFVKQLIAYSNAQLASQHTQAIKQTEAEIASLNSQLASVDAQITALTKTTTKPKTPPTTTTTKPKTPPTTTTTKPKPPPTTTTTTTAVPVVAGDSTSAACAVIVSQRLTCSPSSQYVLQYSSSVPAGDVITTDPGPGTVLPANTSVNLVVSKGVAPTTTTGALKGGQQSGVATLLAARVDLVQAKTSTSTTASSASKDQLGPLQAKQKALQGEYTAALQRLQQLQSSGTPTSGLTLLAPARASQTKAIPGSSNPFAHRSVRGGVGIVGGALIGVAIALLLDALDKRLRKAERASQVFGLPVIAEVPKGRPQLGEAPRAPGAARKKKGAVPPPQPVVAPTFIAVTDEPTSIAAEAYRRLRVAVMFESGQRDPGAGSTETEALVSGGLDVGVGAANVGRTNGAGVGEFHRQVVLVVSPSLEPTIPDVVANLAAAYAEAGQTALVVTTNDLRSAVGAKSSWANTPEPPTIQTRVVEGNLPAPGGSGEPTQPIPAVGVSVPVVSSGGRDTRGPITVEEVSAHCRPQQIHGVLRLELGELLRGPGEMATRGNEVLAATRQIADIVLVEVPSLLATPDAEAVSRSSDAIVVVAECYYTTVPQATRSAGLLRRIGAPVLGVVLTEVEMSRKDLKRMSSAPPKADLKDAPTYALRAGS